ncbi:MAG TPA: GAF domain-containing protein [Chloroflexia bacterium]|nr:GAF domain-containing protein [Chloroflexia bacterium]
MENRLTDFTSEGRTDASSFERLLRLQAFTTNLSRPLPPDEVARVIIENAMEALSASAGIVALLNEAETELRLIYSKGYSEPVQQVWQRFPLTAPGPLAKAVVTGEALWYSSPLELAQAFGHLELEIFQPAEGIEGAALIALPLIHLGRKIGALGLTFASPQQFKPEDKLFLQTLARLGAHTFASIRFNEAELLAQRTAEKKISFLVRLQTVTQALSNALTPQQVCQVIIDEGVAALQADNGLVVLLNEPATEFELVAYTGYHEENLRKWQRFPLSVKTLHTDAVQSLKPVLVDSPELLAERYPQLVASVSNTASKSWASFPLIVEGRVLGALGITYFEPHQFEADEVEFARTLCQQCAQALERASLYEHQQKMRQHFTFLANASLILSSSLDYHLTLRKVADLAVPELADGCTVDIVDPAGEIQRLAVACRTEPGLQALALELLQYPPQSETHPAAKAIRTGLPQIAYDITDELLSTSTRNKAHLAIVQELAVRSYMAIPIIAQGKVVGAINCVLFAVSGRRYVEADRQLVQDFVDRVRLALDNARLYQEAENAIRERNLFLSVAAHELKTPLTSLRGYAQILAERMSRPQLEFKPLRLEQAARNLETQSEKLIRLVNQLLDITRIESGKLELELRPADLVNLLKEVVALAEATTPNKHRLSLKTPAEPVIALIDPLRIEQVITNLLNNAIKFSPEGGAVELELMVPSEKEACLAIRDYGIGVALELRDRIFERFYQANHTQHSGGMGLGLYISKEIVELHHGRIEAEFPATGGSIFKVYLPLAYTFQK